MRITGWHIDGFGTFENHNVEKIPAGLTVFSGPNEAGKSTLLAFVRAMLFGFPGTKSRPGHPPLRGGSHGGRLFLGAGDGVPVVVERQASGRGAVGVTTDGVPGGEHDLRTLLGGCDEDVFRSVFAFGLAELQKLDSLDRGAIGERIFTAGVVGAGRSAHAVLKDLSGRKAELLKQGQGRARINDLLRESEAKAAQVTQAKQASAAYEELGRRIAEADSHVAHHGHALEQARIGRERAVELGNLWPTWRERRDATATLATLTVDPALDLVATDIDDLGRDLARYHDWTEQHRLAEAKRLAAERALAEQLRDLGPAWTRSTLTTFDRSIPRNEEVHALGTGLDEARAARDAATTADRAAQAAKLAADRAATESAALLSELTPPPTRADLDEMADAVRGLRANNADLAAAETRAEGAAAHVAAIEQSPPRPAATDPFSAAAVGYGFGLAAAVLLGMAAWQGITGTIVVAVVLGVLALGLAYLAISAIRRAAPAQGEQERAQQAYTTRLEIAKAEHASHVARAEEILALVAGGAARLGLSPRPSNQDIEAADRRIAHHEDDYRVYVQATRQAAKDADDAGNTGDDAVVASQRADVAERAYRERATAWETWKASAGVPPELSPQGVLTFFDRVRIGRDLLLTLESAERETAAETARIAGNQSHANAAIAAGPQKTALRSGQTGGIGEIGEAVLALGRDVARNRAVHAEMDGLRQTIARCDRALTDALGEGPRAAEMRADLATGDVERWRVSAAAAEDEITAIDAARVAAIKTQVKAVQERDAIEASSDIARFELEHAALLQEIQVAVHEWRVLVVAEGLIRTTLEKFERERQPEVLQHASRLFDAVTAGEYTRLYRPLGDDTGLSITTRTGAVIRPDALSQGTREQLYLCVRLGLAADHASRTGSLPLVMDDVLVNFDPGRARAVAEALCGFAQDHQVLLFTCHPHTVELLRSVQPGCGHFAMRRYGAGGEWVANA